MTPTCSRIECTAAPVRGRARLFHCPASPVCRSDPVGVVMRGIWLPAGLSGLVISKKLEQRFGLLGFARMLKVVELVAELRARDAPTSATVAWGDFMATLSCNQEEAGDFLAYCELARVLDRGNDAGRLRLTLLGELAVLLGDQPAPPPVAGPVLFTKEEQWCEWFLGEWGCPSWMVNEPGTRRLFRRWIATNVTVDEMEAAAERAKDAREAPVPAVLHDHLKAVRTIKIERASR